MKFSNIAIICIILFLPHKVFSQEKFTLSGEVLDYSTRTQLAGSLVELLNTKDSTVVDSTRAYSKNMEGDSYWYTADYYLHIPREKKDYILRFTKNGYEPAYVNISLRNMGKREYSRELKPVLLKRMKQIDLDEVTVTATKVKFYNKGDTLVYNADAFQLAEGSMLDALIRQLPGAELRDNGQIFVNGRFVEDLLLNGKDFFKGNNQIMLDNLPTYLVKDVKVYDKLGKNSEFLGHEMAGDKRYVMDINLKKQYSIGYIGNMEAGGGTKDRYLGRLFAMRFTDHSRIAVYGNINNLNDNRNPGENDGWNPSNMTGGQTTQQTAGLDYSIDDRLKRYELNGNVQFEHADNNIVNNTNRTNFLEGGNTYDRIVSNARKHNMSISTSHRLYFNFKNANLEVKPNFIVRKYDNRTNYSSLTLSEDFANFRKAQLDNMFTSRLGSDFMQSAINRNLRNGMSEGHSLLASISAMSVIKFKKSPDHLDLSADVSYRNSSDKTFDRNLIEYYSGAQLASTDFRNRYYDNMPDHGYHITGKASYGYMIKNGSLNFSYKYERDYTSRNSSLFRLDQLKDWGEDTGYGLGSLPSVETYMKVMDKANSYDSRQYDNSHTIGFLMNISKKTKNWRHWTQIDIPVMYLSRTLHYMRGDMDTTLTKRTVMPASCHGFYQARRNDMKGEFWIEYTLQSKSPDMTMFLNINDTTDPLNTMSGNPNLKNSYSVQFLTHYTFVNPKKRQMLGLQLLYKPTFNDIAIGYLYNKATGKRTFRPANVNGNWYGNFSVYGTTKLNNKGTLLLNAGLGPDYTRCVDLVGVEGSTSTSRSIVKTIGGLAKLNLEYKIGTSTIKLKSEAKFGHTTGTREDFNNFSSADFNYGATANLQLPWKLQLSTDLTMYSRRGYANSDMNTDDLVWNARISRPFFNGKLIALIDGFDILGQLNNITRTVNAQGIEEVYSNVIPKYVMFHVIFRFNKTPKKRN